MNARKKEAATKTWFSQGLRFGCKQCGACCTGEPGFVWVTQKEIKTFAEFLEISFSELNDRYLRRALGKICLKEKKNGDCVFFERPEKKCIVYGYQGHIPGQDQ